MLAERLVHLWYSRGVIYFHKKTIENPSYWKGYTKTSVSKRVLESLQFLLLGVFRFLFSDFATKSLNLLEFLSDSPSYFSEPKGLKIAITCGLLVNFHLFSELHVCGANISITWHLCIACIIEPYLYGGFLKWWYPPNTPKWSFLVGTPIVVGYHHFRKPPYSSPNIWIISSIRISEKTRSKGVCLDSQDAKTCRSEIRSRFSGGWRFKRERVPGKHAPMEIIERFFGSKHLR